MDFIRSSIRFELLRDWFIYIIYIYYNTVLHNPKIVLVRYIWSNVRDVLSEIRGIINQYKKYQRGCYEKNTQGLVWAKSTEDNKSCDVITPKLQHMQGISTPYESIRLDWGVKRYKEYDCKNNRYRKTNFQQVGQFIVSDSISFCEYLLLNDKSSDNCYWRLLLIDLCFVTNAYQIVSAAYYLFCEKRVTMTKINFKNNKTKTTGHSTCV